MRSLLPLGLLALLLLGGCTMTGDPMMAPGTWHPTGANAANLAAMVANPEDLVHGRDAADVPGPLAVAPVEALEKGKAKKLPADELSPMGSSGGSGSSGAGGL